jgi:hypothetical protein
MKWADRVIPCLPVFFTGLERKPDKGPEGKSDCAASIGRIGISIASPLAIRNAQRGQEKKTSMRGQNTPATAKKG